MGSSRPKDLIRGAGRRLRQLNAARPRSDSSHDSQTSVGSPSAVVDRHIRRLTDLFPELADIVQPVLEAEPESSEALFEFCNEYVPLVHEAARETHKRNLLVRLEAATRSETAKASIRHAIALSDLRSGVADRALILDSPTEDDGVRDTFEWAVEEHERQYGARAGMIPNLPHWVALGGDIRGRSLIALLEPRLHELRGKTILHVAPEHDLELWLREHQAAYELTYLSLDAFGGPVDLIEDLTALSLPSESFDYLICHRVLEHILDDRRALSEMHRVLRPGGVLNVSVPQSMQLSETNEWVVQDESHHRHVRQYGRDFEQRLSEAGFDVEVDRMLLDRSLGEHIAAGTYPMRVYLCRR